MARLLAVSTAALTAIVNIPRNNAIDTVTDEDADAGLRDYLGPWAAAHHLHTLLCLAAVALLVRGLCGGSVTT